LRLLRSILKWKSRILRRCIKERIHGRRDWLRHEYQTQPSGAFDRAV